MIVGIVLGLLLLIGIGVVGFLILRKRRKNKGTTEVSANKLSESKVMETSYSKQTHHIVKQDLGGEDEDEEGVASDQQKGAGVQESVRNMLTEDGNGQEKDLGVVAPDK